MRLTADLILGARTFINPLKERELDVRGYRIAQIENLGVTKDQFDTLDLSDNEIKKLGNFTPAARLTTAAAMCTSLPGCCYDENRTSCPRAAKSSRRGAADWIWQNVRRSQPTASSAFLCERLLTLHRRVVRGRRFRSRTTCRT